MGMDCQKNFAETEQPGHHRGNSTESLVDSAMILPELRIAPGETILDVGCGDGYMSKQFSRLVGDSGKIFAIDRSAQTIKNLKKEFQRTNVEALEADITQGLPLPNGSVDLIYLSAVFHCFDKEGRASFIREVKRLLKPDGILAILEINKEQTRIGPPMTMRYSPEELRQLIPLKSISLMKAGEFFYLTKFIQQTEPCND